MIPTTSFLSRARSKKNVLLSLLLTILLTWATSVSAEVLWRGDFETGTTEQWQGAPKIRQRQGRDRARARRQVRLADRRDQRRSTEANSTASNSSINPNRPERPRGRNAISAGASSCPRSSRTTFTAVGYFETRNSWRQLMSFEVRGEDIMYSTRVPYARRWTGKGKLTPGRWHDFAVHVLWSRDPDKGFVEVWFDGEQVVPRAMTATLLDENVAFFQIGFMRDTSDVPETIIIDHVIEATTLEEVTPPPLAEKAPTARKPN